MANRRTRLKDYKGYMIWRINGYVYYAIKPDEEAAAYKAYSLREIKKLVDNDRKD